MSSFSDAVFKRLTAANSLRHLFDNQMRIVQTRTLSGGGKTIIRVPYSSPSTQWRLVGMPELDEVQDTGEWAYYDGFQLYRKDPIAKYFRKEWQKGPLYTQDGFNDDDTFAFNLVESKGVTEERQKSERKARVTDLPTRDFTPPLPDDDDDQSNDENDTE